MIIAIDFDGTCVSHEYPFIGKDIGAIPVLKELVKKGHQLVLNTMRSNVNNSLFDAVNWFRQNDIPLYGINETPGQIQWTSSNKVYAHLYIDEAALGIPLINNDYERSYVDWVKIKEMLINLDIL